MKFATPVFVVGTALTQCADSTNSYAHRAAHHLARCPNTPSARAPKQTAATPAQAPPSALHSLRLSTPDIGSEITHSVRGPPFGGPSVRAASEHTVGCSQCRSLPAGPRARARARPPQNGSFRRSALVHASCSEAAKILGKERSGTGPGTFTGTLRRAHGARGERHRARAHALIGACPEFAWRRLEHDLRRHVGR